MGLYEAAKDAFKIAKSLDNIELQTQLLDLQEQALELVAENQSLKEELALSKMEFRDDGMYWDGDDGPYCPKCIPTGVTVFPGNTKLSDRRTNRTKTDFLYATKIQGPHGFPL